MAFDDLRELAPPDSISTADSTAIALAWENAVDHFPHALTAQSNGIIVGSTNVAGTQSGFSSRNPDIFAVGEGVEAPCATTDGECANNITRVDGSSYAAPQIAGLAAYMRSLDPAITGTRIKDIIEFVGFFGPGRIIDAYLAIQPLDPSLSNAKVRMQLLDVAGNTPASGPNGAFDEQDIQAFLTTYANNQTQGFGSPDYSRHDLNGDGFAGANGTAMFDLDAATPLAITTIGLEIQEQTLSFDESAVSDLDILCYYAYTNLYSGDPAERDGLLTDCVDNSSTVFLGSFQMSGDVGIEDETEYETDTFSTSDGVFFTKTMDASGGALQSTQTAGYNFIIDADGNLTSLTLGGNYASALNLADWDGGGNWAYSTANLFGTFEVIGDPVPANLTFTYSGNVLGPSGVDEVQVVARFQLFQYGSVAPPLLDLELSRTSAGSFANSLPANRMLEAGTYTWFVDLDCVINKESGDPGGSFNYKAALQWSLELTLTP